MSKSTRWNIAAGLLVTGLMAAFTVAAVELPTAEPDAVGMSAEGLVGINEVMQRHIDAGDIQGAVTAIARQGKVVHFEAHGVMDDENERAMEKDAIFIMMSSTKPVLGVAAMMMIEEGKFSPTDEVSHYIPEFKNMKVAVLKDPADEDVSPLFVDRNQIPEHRLVDAATPITIEHLLTHTSGVMSSGFGSLAAPREARQAGKSFTRVSLESYIPTLGDVALDFQPGSRWTYSPGTGLDVVARIVEIVSETPYDEFVQTRIFDPLGMDDTHYNLPANKESRRVVIRDRDMSRFRGRTTTYFSASAGLSSTAEDYLRFEQMLINRGELFGKRLLKPSSVEMMSTNHLGDLYRGFAQNQKGMGYGYTVAVVVDPVAANSPRGKGAFGWGGAFGTRSWTDPAEELTGVIMLQQPHAGTIADFERAVRAAIVE